MNYKFNEYRIAVTNCDHQWQEIKLNFTLCHEIFL